MISIADLAGRPALRG